MLIKKKTVNVLFAKRKKDVFLHMIFQKHYDEKNFIWVLCMYAGQFLWGRKKECRPF